MRFQHVFTYSPEDEEGFLFDKPEAKSGCKQVCQIINEEINALLRGRPLADMA